MAKTSYRSSADRATDAAVIPGARVPPPKELEPEAAKIWNEIVGRLPPDWITNETKPLLKEYCRHSLYADSFARDIEMVRAHLTALNAALPPEDSRLKPKPATLKAIRVTTSNLLELHRAHGYETDRMITLATKMRFTQQSKYFPDKAASKSKTSASAGPKPWHDWGNSDNDPVN
jgi:phage terminase small subunit